MWTPSMLLSNFQLRTFCYSVSSFATGCHFLSYKLLHRIMYWGTECDVPHSTQKEQARHVVVKEPFSFLTLWYNLLYHVRNKIMLVQSWRILYALHRVTYLVPIIPSFIIKMWGRLFWAHKQVGGQFHTITFMLRVMSHCITLNSSDNMHQRCFDS